MPTQERRSSRLSPPNGPSTPSPRAAWTLLGTLEGLGERLRAGADALGESENVEASWLRGAAELLERGEPDRRAVRTEALWLEELALETRAHKAWLLATWVNAAEALRSAIHAHESERGPLVEALFPAWRGASLRRHADQALAAQTELQRRLASGYVVRRLAELTTRSAVGPALEALAAAGTAWAAERDRPALAGARADEVREKLLAAAREAAQLLERVRWLVRAALARRPDLVDTVFPKRTHAHATGTAPSGAGSSGEASGAPAGGAPEALGADVALTSVPEIAAETGLEDGSSSEQSAAEEPVAPERPRRRLTRRRATEAPASGTEPARAGGTRRRPAGTFPEPASPDQTRRRAPRGRPAKGAATRVARESAIAPPESAVPEHTRRRAPRRRPTDDATAHVARGPVIAHPEPAPPERPRRSPRRAARRSSRPPRRS